MGKAGRPLFNFVRRSPEPPEAAALSFATVPRKGLQRKSRSKPHKRFVRN